MTIRPLIIGLSVILITALSGIIPAYATQTQICGNLGSGYCLNDWNGDGSPGADVNMYYGNSSNEDFWMELLNPCNSTPAGRVTETCPFTVGSGWNAEFAGDPIFEIAYDGSSYCVSSESVVIDPVIGVLENCGATGSMFILTPECYFVSRYWTDVYYSDYGITPSNGYPGVTLNSGGSPGANTFYSLVGTSATQWGPNSGFGCLG